LPHSSRFRTSIKHIGTRSEALELIEAFRETVESGEQAAACA
jgi:hypothetical protein